MESGAQDTESSDTNSGNSPLVMMHCPACDGTRLVLRDLKEPLCYCGSPLLSKTTNDSGDAPLMFHEQHPLDQIVIPVLLPNNWSNWCRYQQCPSEGLYGALKGPDAICIGPIAIECSESYEVLSGLYSL